MHHDLSEFGFIAKQKKYKLSLFTWESLFHPKINKSKDKIFKKALSIMGMCQHYLMTTCRFSWLASFLLNHPVAVQISCSLGFQNHHLDNSLTIIHQSGSKYSPFSPTLRWIIVLVYTTQAEQQADERVVYLFKSKLIWNRKPFYFLSAAWRWIGWIVLG